MKLKNAKVGMYLRFGVAGVKGDYVCLVTHLNYIGSNKIDSVNMRILKTPDPANELYYVGEDFEDWDLSHYHRLKRPAFRITDKPVGIDAVRIGQLIYNQPDGRADEDYPQEFVGMVMSRSEQEISILVLDTANPDFHVGEVFEERHLSNFRLIKKPKWKDK